MSLVQSTTTSFNVPKFPCFGVIEATHPKDEKILSFDYETLEIKQWRKEKVEKKASFAAVLISVRDILDPCSFTLYFNDGILPWSFYCPTQEHCVMLCGYLNQCATANQNIPNLLGSDQLYCSTWVEKKGKVKWARRWIALVGCRLLCYRNEGTAPKGRKAPSTVPLNVIPISGNIACTKFTLATNGTDIMMTTFREYKFRFGSKQEATVWLQAIQQAATRQDIITLARPSRLGNGAHAREVTEQGETKTRSNSFILRTNSNSYYKSTSNSNSKTGAPSTARRKKERRNSVIQEPHKDSSGKNLSTEPNSLRLYTWGSNKKGQLAVTAASVQSSSRPQRVEALRDRNTPLRVACGYSHMACITTNGQLFMWGDGKHGQLGLGARVKQSSRPYLVSSLKTQPIKMVTCGRMHTVAVTTSGSVMSWGKGERGALGLGDSITHTTEPQALDIVGRAYGLPVLSVSCSTEHTAIVTVSGR